MGQRGVDESDEELINGGSLLGRRENGEELVPEVHAQHGDLRRGVGVENEKCLSIKHELDHHFEKRVLQLIALVHHRDDVVVAELDEDEDDDALDIAEDDFDEEFDPVEE